jgi:hypothetical protein
MATKWRILIGLVFLGVGILIFRPVPIPHEKDCLTVKAKVTEVFEAGFKDIVFKLQGLDKEFYINRGLEKGLDLQELRASLINKEIIILYPAYWTPLDPSNSIRHISKMEHDGKIVFTEIN